MDHILRNLKSFAFKNSILNLITAFPGNSFDCDNHKDFGLITQLHVGLNHLREHKFKHNFGDSLNPVCSCGVDIKSTLHFVQRYALVNTLNKIDCKLLELMNSSLSHTLLYGKIFDKEKNHSERNNWIYFIDWKVRRASYSVNFCCYY